jgi:predicted transcriptional regulator
LGGISQGRRPELVGGVRDQPEKGEDKSDRGSRDGESAVDQRILGDEDFVTRVKKEVFSDERERRFDFREIKKKIQSIVEVSCREGDVRIQELQMGSRRHQVTEVRAKIARKLVNELGISLREVAYHLGVSSSAISKMLQRRSL